MQGISLFSGGGVGESRLHEQGIEIRVANELLPQRAEVFEALNPSTNLLIADIRDLETKDLILSRGQGVELVLATPPCQGVSVAGKNRNPSSQTLDERNYLIFDAIEIILRLEPKYVVFENVARFLDLMLPHEGRLLLVPELLNEILGKYYRVSYRTLNAADFGVAQDRRRAIIVLTRVGEKEYTWPTEQPGVTFKDLVGHLPSLESGEDSGIPFHYARRHDPRHIFWMRHTPTGQTAFNNSKHYPQDAVGNPIRAYKTTYRRMQWHRPAPTITMRNDAISSQANVHPGRLLPDGTYSDARVLTPLELLLLSSIDPGVLVDVQLKELEIRKALGESLPPLLLNAVIGGLK